MPDWYDKLISVLGLDPIRQDVMFGTPIGAFPEWTFRDSGGTARPSLCQLPDGRAQLVFELRCGRTPWVGFLPASARNLAAFGEFLGRIPAPCASTAIPSSETLEMAPLLDRYLDSVIELSWRAVAGGGPRLGFTIRGPRGYLRQELDWTPELACALAEMLAEAQARVSAWPVASS